MERYSCRCTPTVVNSVFGYSLISSRVSTSWRCKCEEKCPRRTASCLIPRLKSSLVHGYGRACLTLAVLMVSRCAVVLINVMVSLRITARMTLKDRVSVQSLRGDSADRERSIPASCRQRSDSRCIVTGISASIFAVKAL